MKNVNEILQKSNLSFSIVIPAYGNHFDDFKRCWESITKYTENLSKIEVVIVANGCTEPYKEYLEEIKNSKVSNFKYLWYFLGL